MAEPWALPTLGLRSSQHSAAEELRGADKEDILGVVKTQGRALKHLNRSFRADREVALEAVKQSGESLKYASRELRADKVLVLEAVKNSGAALEHASKELRADRDVVLQAVKQDGRALEHARTCLRSDKEVVLEAVKQHGPALLLAKAFLRADREVVLAAVQQHWQVFEYASKDLQADRDLVLEVVKIQGHTFEFASEELQADREIVIEAMKTWENTLEFAGPAMRADKDLVLLAARDTRVPINLVRTCMVEAGINDEIHFGRAVDSAIGVPGVDQAPILSVSVSKVRADEPPCFMDPRDWQCEAFLMSGATLCFNLNDDEEHFLSSPDSRRNVADLAAAAAYELYAPMEEDAPCGSAAFEVKRVFLNFIVDDGDAVAVTPWDWEKPLRDFLPLAQRGSYGKNLFDDINWGRQRKQPRGQGAALYRRSHQPPPFRL